METITLLHFFEGVMHLRDYSAGTKHQIKRAELQKNESAKNCPKIDS